MKINKKGFTLIELLAVIVVIAIIGIITITISISIYNKSKEKSEKVFESQIKKTIESYITLKGSTLQYDNIDLISYKYATSTTLGETIKASNIFSSSDLINPSTKKECSNEAIINIFKTENGKYCYNTDGINCLNNEINTCSSQKVIDVSSNLNVAVVPGSATETLINNSSINNDYTYKKGVTSTESNLNKVPIGSGENTYIYAGAVDNNFVSFAGFKWIIVRINSDGSLRLLKQTSIGTSKWNNKTNDLKYAGFTYQVDGVTTDSTIKKKLDDWYNANLIKYDNSIAIEDYCNEVKIDYSDSNSRYYLSGSRYNKYKNPDFACSDTALGYGGKYNLKIGLLTLDEARYAGMDRVTNKSAYIYNSSNWWLMTPFKLYFTSTYSEVDFTYINSVGQINVGNGTGLYNVRPVINLKSSVKFESGKGTSEDPYVVK